ncbi:NADH-quinone oxidoreductase subunit NuoE [Larsenimonas rhizosphaerae]|uniref:NADH-quinone oxidoreductase subunit E n=1 Tax=Larsenimonas rhizosphaerae TaxID=2944682 RepID=A0AA42CYF0_9GAMM|nr:NADH-quinone oxidoreductase subunit NuoE [Larsenimonas rhizosphaerae]MCM2131545.1 NADH-quinone oxidoreductase subunit NuoE [Larsenimonas rhizosphaerae]MCX2525128.1 NADH-quinone oxidoreductase subunit NuoE [Larsenimonas rhizosphaerae]
MNKDSLIFTDRPGSDFVLHDDDRHAIEHEMSHYENPRAASIGALKIVQKRHGWVPDGAIYAISDVLGISSSDVEGVATFYSLIFRQPVGRHVILLCDSMTCYINGYESVRETLKDALGISPGQTTADGRFTLLPVCCLGNCDKGPAMMVDEHIHGPVSPDNVMRLLEEYS